MHWVRSGAASLALLGAAISTSCGGAKSDGLYDALSGAGGAAGGSSVAGASGSGAGGSPAAGAGGQGVAGAAGASSAGAAGSGGEGSEAGASGAAGTAAVIELDAGVDAAFPDASASRLSCAPAQQPDCAVLASALTHRYSFAGTGNAVLDTAGSAHGAVINGQLSGAGSVVLTGAASPENYVDLPNGIISSLASATFEAWLTWDGGAPWQRIFDFGPSAAAEGARAGGAAYLFLTPRSAADTVRLTFISSETPGEVQVNSLAPLPTGVPAHLAAVIDAQAATLALFIDGAPVGSIALPSSLSALATDNNNWLGRSAFPTDPGFAGTLHELRIYSAALSAQQVALSYQLGAEAELSE